MTRHRQPGHNRDYAVRPHGVDRHVNAIGDRRLRRHRQRWPEPSSTQPLPHPLLHGLQRARHRHCRRDRPGLHAGVGLRPRPEPGRRHRASVGALVVRPLRDDYTDGWRDYDSGLAQGTLPLDANVLKASEDKTFPRRGRRLVGPARGAGGEGRQATYFVPYREVFARGTRTRAFTGFLARRRQIHPPAPSPLSCWPGTAADRRAARRNSAQSTAKIAPEHGGDQLDETAYPILMAQLTGLTDNSLWTRHIKPAADYLLAPRAVVRRRALGGSSHVLWPSPSPRDQPVSSPPGALADQPAPEVRGPVRPGRGDASTTSVGPLTGSRSRVGVSVSGQRPAATSRPILGGDGGTASTRTAPPSARRRTTGPWASR